MTMVHHHAPGRFDWLISGHHSVNLSRAVISMLFGKCKTLTFAHPLGMEIITDADIRSQLVLLKLKLIQLA